MVLNLRFKTNDEYEDTLKEQMNQEFDNFLMKNLKMKG